jgi:hypothetical protein
MAAAAPRLRALCMLCRIAALVFEMIDANQCNDASESTDRRYRHAVCLANFYEYSCVRGWPMDVNKLISRDCAIL